MALTTNPTQHAIVQPFKDITPRIMDLSDLKSCAAFACVNKEWSKHWEAFWDARLNIKIVGAKEQGIKVDDELPVDMSQVRKSVKKQWLNNIRGSEGYVLLTMCKGTDLVTDLSKLQMDLFKAGMIESSILETEECQSEALSKPIEKTYRVILTDGFCPGTENMKYYDQVSFLEKQQCQLPSLHEFTTLVTHSDECFLRQTKDVRAFSSTCCAGSRAFCISKESNYPNMLSISPFCKERAYANKQGAIARWVYTSPDLQAQT